MAVALGFAIVGNFAAFWWSHQMVLQTYNAQAVSESSAPELTSVVQSLASRNGVPAPDIYVIPRPAANAFATGRSPSNSAIAVTNGLLSMMEPTELEGVLAHELGHINNRDTLISTITAVLAGAIMNLSGMLRWFSIAGGHNKAGDYRGMAQRFALAVLAPMAATLIQFGISRSREFLADESAAKYTGNPHGLASALEKLEKASLKIQMKAEPATAHLFIVNPLTGTEGPVRWFSTHPPIAERVARLRAMTHPGGTL